MNKLHRYSLPDRNHEDRNWYLVSSQGSVLYYIAANPGCTAVEIADAFNISRSAVSGTVRGLLQAEMIHASRIDRRSHYMVNLDAPFDHPALTGYTLRNILGGLATVLCTLVSRPATSRPSSQTP